MLGEEWFLAQKSECVTWIAALSLKQLPTEMEST